MCYTVCLKLVHKSKQESMHDILINIFSFLNNRLDITMVNIMIVVNSFE